MTRDRGDGVRTARVDRVTSRAQRIVRGKDQQGVGVRREVTVARASGELLGDGGCIEVNERNARNRESRAERNGAQTLRARARDMSPHRTARRGGERERPGAGYGSRARFASAALASRQTGARKFLDSAPLQRRYSRRQGLSWRPLFLSDVAHDRHDVLGPAPSRARRTYVAKSAFAPEGE